MNRKNVESKLRKVIRKEIKNLLPEIEKDYPEYGVRARIKLKLLRKNTDEIMKAAGVKGESAEDLKKFYKFMEDNYTIEEITEAINSQNASDLPIFPSNTTAVRGVEYPAFLAKALVKSDDSDPFYDLANMYYRRTNISPEARLVFYKRLLESPDDLGAPWSTGSDNSFPETYGYDNDGSEESVREAMKDAGVFKSPELRKFIKKFYPEYSI